MKHEYRLINKIGTATLMLTFHLSYFIYFYMLLWSQNCCVCCLNIADNIVHLLTPSSCFLGMYQLYKQNSFFFFTEDSLLIFYLRSRCGWSMNHCICSIYVVMNKHVYTPLPTCTSLNSHKLLRSLQERSRERLFTRAYLQDKREWLQNERE